MAGTGGEIMSAEQGHPAIIDEQQGQQVQAAAIRAMQRVSAYLTDQGRIPFGTTLVGRVCWPQQHREEIYLFIGMENQPALHVEAITKHALDRLQQPGGVPGFNVWLGLQALQEFLVFQYRPMVRMVQRSTTSGIVLPN